MEPPKKNPPISGRVSTLTIAMAGCWLALSLACVVKSSVGLGEFCVDWYREVCQVSSTLLLTSISHNMSRLTIRIRGASISKFRYLAFIIERPQNLESSVKKNC